MPIILDFDNFYDVKNPIMCTKNTSAHTCMRAVNRQPRFPREGPVEMAILKPKKSQKKCNHHTDKKRFFHTIPQHRQLAAKFSKFVKN